MTLSQEVIQARETAKELPVYPLYSLISDLRWEMIVVEPNFIILEFKASIYGEAMTIPLNRIMDTMNDLGLQTLDLRENEMDIILKEDVDGEELMHQMAYLDWLQRPHRIPGALLISYRDDEGETLSMGYSAYVSIRHLERTLSMHHPRPSFLMTNHPLWSFYKIIEGRNWCMMKDGTFLTSDPILMGYLPPPYDPNTKMINYPNAYEILQMMELSQHPWRTDFPWDDVLIHEPA